jgi:hypothetical protein
MKQNALRMALLGVLTVSLCITSGCISTRRFQTGFHLGLGMQAAQAVVGTAIGALGGITGSRGRVVGSNCAWSRDRYASPYEEAYAREAARLERERYNRWVRAEHERGRADARRHAGW